MVRRAEKRTADAGNVSRRGLLKGVAGGAALAAMGLAKTETADGAPSGPATVTDLARFIADSPMIDTHEHPRRVDNWDVLADLFGWYQRSDLQSAGADPKVLDAALDPKKGNLETRFAAIRPFYEAMRHTGYGEKVRIQVRDVFGLDDLTPATLAAAQAKLEAWKRPEEILRLFRDVARLDHVQIDDSSRSDIQPDADGPDFYLCDMSWQAFSAGRIDARAKRLAEETGVTVGSLADLRKAFEGLFEKYGRLAIALKSQHAYSRTLLWRPRTDADAEAALQKVLKNEGSEETRLCLGDWCLGAGADLAARYNLPIKIHTGYYAGVNGMRMDYIKPGHLGALLRTYPKTRFVLMHAAYPYGQELIALVKHYTNAYADCCWAWAMDPFATMDFVRRFLHSAPANKLFIFGGDAISPTHTIAYAIQARRWLTRTLEAEVAAGDLTEAEAIAAARRVMLENQRACFDVERARAAIAAAMR